MKDKFVWLVLCSFLLAMPLVLISSAPATAEPKGTVNYLISGLGTENLDVRSYIESSLFPIGFALWDGLIMPEKKFGELGPGLATSWDVSAGGKDYTFHLRKGVKFHDGAPFTAKDVKFSIETYKTGTGAADVQKFVKSVEIVDDHTAIVHLTDPWPEFMAMVGTSTAWLGWAVPKDYVDKVGKDGYGKHPIGTGPYKFVKRIIGDRHTYEANEDYWGKVSEFKTLNIRIIPEAATIVAMMKTGQGDVAAIPFALVDDVKKGAGIKVIANSTINTTWLMFMGQYEKGNPMADIRVRKALNYAIDKKTFVKELFYGYATPSGGIMNPNQIGYSAKWNDKIYSYDPEKAKKLLAEAGYAKGLDLGKLHYWTSAKEESEALAGYFAAVGVKVQSYPRDAGAYLKDLWEGLPRGIGAMQSNMGGDIAYRIRVFDISGSSYPYLYHPEIDRLYKAQFTETNVKKRMEILEEEQRIIHEEARYLFLWRADVVFAYNSKKIKELNIWEGARWPVRMNNFVMQK